MGVSLPAEPVSYVVNKSLKPLWETLADSWYTFPFALGDTNDNKTAVGPEDVSKMGCPCLGEHTKLEVVIEESYEFKVNENKQQKLSAVGHQLQTLVNIKTYPLKYPLSLKNARLDCYQDIITS